MNLKPVHVFENEGKCYAFNVINMRVAPLTSRQAEKLRQGIYDVEHEAVVKKLGLILPLTCNNIEDYWNEESIMKKCFHDEMSFATMCLFVTQECNMNCIYCYGECGSFSGSGFMQWETAQRAIDWFLGQADEDVDIIFFGGEPLLNFSLIKKITAYIKFCYCDKKVRYSFNTNGTLLTEEIICYLVAEKINITISIDGSEYIQNKNRPLKSGKPSFRQVTKNALKMLEVRPLMSCRATLMEEDNAFFVFQHLWEMGFRNIGIEPASCEKNSKEKMLETRQQLLRFSLQKMYTGLEEHSVELVRQSLANVEYRETFYQLWQNQDWYAYLLGKQRFFFCGAGRKMVSVSAEGELYPCQRFTGKKEFCIGEIGQVENKQSDVCRKSVILNNFKCRQCWIRYFCGGGCVYDHYYFGGSLFNVDESFCTWMIYKTERILALIASLTKEDKEWLWRNRLVPNMLCEFDF